MRKTKEQLKQEAIVVLKEIQKNTDKEVAHSRADGVLCDLLVALVLVAVVDEWDKVGKWYG